MSPPTDPEKSWSQLPLRNTLPALRPRGMMGDNIRLAIEYVSPATLRPDDGHPRKHSRKQLTQIMRSVERLGNLVPILVDAGGRVICGHARLAAAMALGRVAVPVIRADHLSEAEIRAFQIADNRLTENGEWDQHLLGLAFKELSLQGLDLDLEITGFDMPEIDLLIAGLDDGSAAADEDDAPAPCGALVTRVGDLWEVQGHRILCGDARDAVSYAALMADELAAMIFADPPYNVRVQGFVGGRGKIKHAEFAMASGEMSEADYIVFLVKVYQRAAEVAARGALAYWCIDWRHSFEALVAGREAYAALRNLCVWAKTQPGQGSFYRSQHELVLVFDVTGDKTRNNVQLGRFGRNRSNLWSYPSPAHLSGDEGRKPLEDHPTPKPLKMIADAILDCTARGEIVLDPFLGGGATLLAAERTGRRCRGMEIEPRYVDAALRRLRRLTGDDPIRVSDGRSFSELEAEASDGVR